MIITRIKGSNILKYRRLELALPESGLIAISGQNESGKSSIGEAVCFALFGRTFSIGPDDLDKVVRWGENHCAVTLDFTVDGVAWELSRMLDRDGNHGASLTRVGDEEPVARGVKVVNERLVELIGFEYEQFVESFYLAQREITTPHPHSQAVKIMAGIAPLERVREEFAGEIRERHELLGEMQAEIDTVRSDLDALDVEPGRLERLEREHATLRDQVDQIRGLGEEIGQRMDTYAEHMRAIYQAQSARSRASFLRFVFFLLTLVALALWWLLGEGADMPLAGQVRGLLDQYAPQYVQVPLQWWLWGAAGLGGLFLLSWLRVAAQGGRVRRLRAEAGQLAESLQRARNLEIEQPLPEAEEEVPAAPAGEVAEEASEDEAGEEASVEVAPERPDAMAFESLVERIASGEAAVRQVRAYVEPELAWLEWVREQLDAQVATLDAAIEEEQARLREAANLEQVLEGLREQREEGEARIRLRETAIELLGGAVGALSNQFNRDIKELVARLLPRFTDGRYEHLQIDRDLSVRVFSAEKRDFMDLEEVSSGTQRQIMLALRLALSQKLLARTVHGRQFAFLDEPFAFFDEERTRCALGALADLGEDISQVWIVAQSFPEDAGVGFDVHIECYREQDELVRGVE